MNEYGTSALPLKSLKHVHAQAVWAMKQKIWSINLIYSTSKLKFNYWDLFRSHIYVKQCFFQRVKSAQEGLLPQVYHY